MVVPHETLAKKHCMPEWMNEEAEENADGHRAK
jgi:hypothetical protein